MKNYERRNDTCFVIVNKVTNRIIGRVSTSRRGMFGPRIRSYRKFYKTRAEAQAAYNRLSSIQKTYMRVAEMQL